ncbi:hypothetical protein GUITHDRAFT_105527 [Guillardia theta CCMP2712]|uniref:Cns1/TTC4 wheel domain-containing protein n=2 Tax=Guillardia theta TaxID=55529 RepID=L1JK56_GUITC|nr:hypothetical protein GUITHDRAFT_105527 [Guillardia theta CCMP2712]EKX48903.1 hypothetical protein GUITHDRAFT_105527 [Guillardia theta CCMP2712]|eukprot:XP_005835883.1 hypothetical protein GUITHDRAFT_105527 [Guillardia theta CCMP2712]
MEERKRFQEFVWSKRFVDEGHDPLFMEGLTEAEAEQARDEWINAIMEGEEDADQAAEYHKVMGNKAVSSARELKEQGNENSSKFYVAAAQHYTTALCKNCSDVMLRAACFSNRAMCHLQRGNLGHVIRDCNATLSMFEAYVANAVQSRTGRRGAENSKHMFPMTHLLARRAVHLNRTETQTLVKLSVKSCVRAARASLGLQRFASAVFYCNLAVEIACDHGMKDSQSTDVIFTKHIPDILQEANQQQETFSRQETIKKLEHKSKLRERVGVRRGIHVRGILLGPCIYPEFLQRELIDVNVIGEELCWPLLLVYEESRCTDFLRQCSEAATLDEILEPVLDCPSPPYWDPEHRYWRSTVSLYFIAHQVPLMKGGKSEWLTDPVTGRRHQPTWQRIDMGWTLREFLQAEGHVVPGYPVIHVVLSGSKFEEKMLGSDPVEFFPR